MNDSLNDIRQTVILTKYYSFDLGNYTIRELIIKWTKLYPHNWLPLAVTEAIYQGRLKAISIEQILNIWLKKGRIYYSFNYEFIRLVQPDSSFELEEQSELQDIVTISCEKLESTQKKLSLHSTYNNLSAQENSVTNQQIDSKQKLNEFQPIKDSSHCFQKLKSLASNDKF